MNTSTLESNKNLAKMFVRVVFLTVLFTIVTPSAIRVESCNATGVSRPIENLEEIIGTTKFLYAYFELHLPEPICVDNVISVPSIQEISAYETICGKLGDVKLKIEANLVFSAFISQGNNKTYLRYSCQDIQIELRSVDGLVLWNLPEFDISELSGKVVLSKDELECVADKIDVMQGKKGFPICWNL